MIRHIQVKASPQDLQLESFMSMFAPHTEGAAVGELPDMMTAKLSDSFTLFPSPHLYLIYTIKFTQPPFRRPLFHDPLPPLRCGHHTWKLPNGISLTPV